MTTSGEIINPIPKYCTKCGGSLTTGMRCEYCQKVIIINRLQKNN